MKTTYLILVAALAAATAMPLRATAEPLDMTKRAEELKSLRWGMFICWSFSTFSGKEWTPGVTDVSFFKATGCDTDQWARTAKEAGMGYILFLTKHHDGFCLWDTKTTDRKVTRNPLGKDVLAELRKSCQKQGIKLALYFSEGDWTWPGAADGKGWKAGVGKNPEMKKAQLAELLTQYGPVEYLWFDHAVGDGGLSHAETIALCKSLQPGCFVGFNHGDQEGSDIRLGEMGRPGPLADHAAAGPHMKDAPAASYRLAEFTYPILPPHKGGAMWFYSLPEHDKLCHPAEKLYRDYLGAVKYGNIFSIDVGPDYSGRLRAVDVATLRKVGEMIRRKAPHPDLAYAFKISAGDLQPVAVVRDKMQGAWLGQMIGVGWNAPTEFQVKGEEMAKIKGTREHRKANRSQTASIKPLPFKVPAKLPDVAEVLSPSAVCIEGWLGARVDANEASRLLVVDTEPLLAGFRKKPGSHPWIGEHVGKWMHAATLAWANTGDAALREKLDRVAAELIAAQEPDGYLGTYVPEQRFSLIKGADWDVWSHKYNLIGLLTYYQFTGNEAALNACRKMGDLLIATFPAKKSILAAGTHVGMAATSVLEPAVLLYRLTGDERYLDFARYIVKSWDEPKGPAILKTLLAEKQVNKVANGKAYEMLSNLVGLCELARVTGDREMLQAVRNAWQDIVDKRLYITGSASQGEHFPADHELRNDAVAHIGETCVTTTWIQFNLQLLRLTGEAKFGDELERAFYNHLAAAQHPQGHDWCYYTALEGKKPYDKGISCCHSSGPRGMALVPQSAYLAGRDALLVSTFETSSATLELGGQRVTVEQQSHFPRRGESVLTLRLAKPATFAVKIRAPAWAAPVTVKSASVQSGWAVLPVREWKDGDRIAVKYNLAARLVAGEYGNTGRAALTWGPFVLAYDQKLNPDLPKPSALGLVELQPPLTLKPGSELAFGTKVVGATGSQPTPARLVTFADAGADGGVYRVWLRAPGVAAAENDSLLAGGAESRSRQGNQHGSINDDDFDSIVVTYDGKTAKEDWFAVTLAAPVSVRRVVFAHGRNFYDGGWFDASAGKPQVQVQRGKGSEWETVGELSDYPATTATDNKKLKPGQTFTLRLSNPEKVLAVRVLGAPACGNNPKQAFSSCAELQAFAE